jgi:hypothetical protein
MEASHTHTQKEPAQVGRLFCGSPLLPNPTGWPDLSTDGTGPLSISLSDLWPTVWAVGSTGLGNSSPALDSV